MAQPEQNNQVKSCYWSITINNPTDDDYIRWEGLKGEKWVRKVMGQLEKGENGTPHIQGMLNTEHVRFSQIKKALPRAHIEVAKKPVALAHYVQKEDTRLSPLPTTRVATQIDVQRESLALVIDEYIREYPYLSPLLPHSLDQKHFYNWMTNYNLLHRNWPEAMLDAAVKKLVREGYYGIEFVMCNPQVRLAFKKYFCEIVIREYAARSNASPSESQSQFNAQS